MEFEPWVGDHVRYNVANEPSQVAEIIAVCNHTEASIRILTGPQNGRELVVPWGVIEPMGTIWRRFDPNDIDTHPEDDRKIELQFFNGQRYEGRYAHSIGFFCHFHPIPEETLSLDKRWRYIDEPLKT
jgi:hypothetical protein